MVISDSTNVKTNVTATMHKPKIVQVLLVGCGNAVHVLSAAMSHQFSSEFEFKVNILSTHAED